jgi:hypothetical protein
MPGSACCTEREDHIYTAGHQTDVCTLVLTGRLKIVAGVEGFISEAGPFSVLAVGSLT